MRRPRRRAEVGEFSEDEAIAELRAAAITQPLNRARSNSTFSGGSWLKSVYRIQAGRARK
jgi:hypothetical protein